MMQGYSDHIEKYLLPRMQGWLEELTLFATYEDRIQWIIKA